MLIPGRYGYSPSDTVKLILYIIDLNDLERAVSYSFGPEPSPESWRSRVSYQAMSEHFSHQEYVRR